MRQTVAAEHHRLLSELLYILMASSFITSLPEGSYRAADTLADPAFISSLRSIAAEKTRLEREIVPDLAANVVLVWACTQALPDILRGKVKVPDVMFPEGSPHLVEPIYKNPKLSAPFNQQLAAAVRAYVQDRLQVRSLHVRCCFLGKSTCFS